MIRAEKLFKSYTSGPLEIPILRGIDLEVKKGEFLMIMGRSGAGKSTLLYQLSLLDHPTAGEVFLDDHRTSTMSRNERTRFRLEKLGYIFQDYATLPDLTAEENVILPLLMKGMSYPAAHREAKRALERVGLIGKGQNLPSQLSGGEQQRVSVARAIGHNPKILFADEPTANLDSETAEKIIALFSDLHHEGQTVVMVTHEAEYGRVADRVITLNDGRIIDEKRKHH